MNKPVTLQLQQILDQMSEYDVFQSSPLRSEAKQLQHARKLLIDARNNSYKNRQHFLDHKQSQNIESGQTSQANVIRQIQQAEQRKYCWNTFKLLRKGPQSSGGLTHILVPNNPNDNTKHTRIQTKSELDAALLQRNIDHFRQAQGTPFTTSSICEYLGDDGCNQNTIEIFKGNVSPNLPKFVKLLLQQFKKTDHKPIDIPFTFEDMCKGFLKWRERTTTSPSGKHLGIYKSLIKSFYHHQESSTESNQITHNVANDCLQIQHLLMQLAIHHCYTFSRWKKVHNFLLEKNPRNAINQQTTCHSYIRSRLEHDTKMLRLLQDQQDSVLY
jgi:hypothetical protein